ncbi:PLP-dependent transferase [Calocera viscosa TUFC12733]|uniref:PLP-dependent transferase n=1 Tax=Calocera viscosa (strain TUFC12733) TaxID=1330018 RepID=A0A167KB37_CALVF|nr:PLP-dependent transferase [Calocera viscosa TUFC12733]
MLTDAYDATHNPDGYINLNAAQNTLQQAELLDFLSSRFTLKDVDFTFGDDFSGSQRLLKALARFVNKQFDPIKQVTQEDIVVGSGCGPISEQLLHFIADQGDGVLIPVPYFPGYTGDLMLRNGLKPVAVPVKLEDHFSATTIPLFEAALKQAEADGTPIRAVILCNPHNPLGQCYPKETILAYARFCEEHDLHLVCDEIFAFSIFPSDDVPNASPFVSALSLDLQKEAGCNPSRVHVMYGFSKDFNANGLRAGALISPYNNDILTAVRATSNYMKISGATSVLWSLILEDDAFWLQFLAENRKRLAKAYRFATAWLKFQHIPYFPAYAGHFVSGKSLRPVEEDKGAARDAEMIRRLLAAKVFVGSAAAFAYPTPGWVRITFAMRRDYLVVGLARLESVFELPRYAGLDGEKAQGKNHVLELGEVLEKTAL